YYPGNALSSVLSSGAANVSGQGGGATPTNNGVDVGDTPENALGPRSEDAASVPNGPNAMGGSALLLFGQDGFAFGISTHREEWYGASPGAMLGVGDLQLYGNHRQ